MSITEIGNGLDGIAETLARVIAELTTLTDSVTKLSGALKNEGNDHAVPPAALAQKKEPEFTDVRALLAEVSRGGKTAEVRQLLEKHGCQKLSEVGSELYEQLMEEARAL